MTLVVANLTEVSSHIRLGPPKSKASKRTVIMPEFLVEELAQHLAQYRDPDGWVFPASQGGPVRRTNFRRRFWLPAVRASVGGPLRFHDLRHTHAALLIAQGVHVKVLQDRLGHASITTTARHIRTSDVRTGRGSGGIPPPSVRFLACEPPPRARHQVP